MESQSPKGKLDKVDWKNIGNIAVKAALAAAVTAVAQELSSVDFGESTAVVVALLTIVVEALDRLRKGDKSGDKDEKIAE